MQALILLLALTGVNVQLEPTKQYSGSALTLTGSVNTSCDSSVHLVGAPACASFSLAMGGYTEATLLITFTRGTATQLDAWLDGSIDGSTPWAVQAAGDSSALPLIAMGEQDVRWSSISGSGFSQMVTFKNLNAPYVRWRFYGAGSASSLSITLVRRGP